MGKNKPAFALHVLDRDSPNEKFEESTSAILQFQQAAAEDLPR